MLSSPVEKGSLLERFYQTKIKCLLIGQIYGVKNETKNIIAVYVLGSFVIHTILFFRTR